MKNIQILGSSEAEESLKKLMKALNHHNEFVSS